MKKKIFSAFLAVFMLFTATASAFAAPRWSYFNTVTIGISMKDSKIKWGVDANTYQGTEVTATKCTITLQAANSYGWYEVDSDTTMLTGNFASAGGYYADWTAGTSYRIKVEAWAYDGNSVIESVGPFYDYYNA